MSDQDDTYAGSKQDEGEPGSLPPGLLISLEVIAGPDKGLKARITETTTTLGRKDADVKFNDPTVSGKHANLEFVGGKLFLTDNNSTNGTKVNGDPVESSPVDNLDEISLGDTKILLSVTDDRYGVFLEHDEEADESRALDEPTAITHKLPNPPVPTTIYVVLEVMEGADKGKKFKVENRSTIIGRSPRADFVLEDPAVSMRHCQIEIHDKDKMTVKDLASANGTRLNNHYVSAVKIRDQDLIHIGETKIKILVHLRK